MRTYIPNEFVAITILFAAIICGVDSASAAQSLKMSGVVHVQDLGDQPFADSRWVGTRGESLRLEGFAFDFSPTISGLGLEYMCHVQNSGDSTWMSGGNFCGTRGQSKRLEGLAIRLTGPESANYDIYFACHLQDVGDRGLLETGGFCGTRGESRRLEAFAVWVLPKGSPRPELAPSISSFAASPNDGYINVGDSATLSWQTVFCGSDCLVSLRGRDGLGTLVLNVPKVNSSGSRLVTPHYDTTYTLQAVNPVGSASKQKLVSLYGTSPSGTVFYFKMTTTGIAATQCFTIAVYALDQASAKRIAEQTNGGYNATSIDADQFTTACN